MYHGAGVRLSRFPVLHALTHASLGFFINLPIGAVAAVFLLLITIPDQNIRNTDEKISLFKTLGKLDLVGFVLFAPSATMILMALQWGGTKYPWNSATIIGLFCGGFGMALVFLGWEYRVGDKAMIPFSMLRVRAVWASCVANAFFYGTMLIFSYYIPIYFQSVKGVSPALSGVYMLPAIIAQMICSIVCGVLGKQALFLCEAKADMIRSWTHRILPSIYGG